MAVTSIWPIKGRVDKVINYARNPEKTTEAARPEQAALHAIDGVVEFFTFNKFRELRQHVFPLSAVINRRNCLSKLWRRGQSKHVLYSQCNIRT